MKRVSVATVAGAVALLIAGVAGSAQAQGMYFQLGVGASIPTGDLKDEASTGFLAQAAAGVSRGVVGGRVSATYTRHGIKNTDFNYRIIGAMADLVISPKAGGSAKPYLLGGVGVQNRGSNVTGSSSETKFAWNVGGGVAVGSGRVGFFVEARYLTVIHEQSNTTLIPISAGIRIGGR